MTHMNRQHTSVATGNTVGGFFMNAPLPIRFRDRLVRIIRQTQQLVTDAESFNSNRLDAEPLDFETDKILLHLARQALSAYDAGDWDEHARLSTEMADMVLAAAEDAL